MENKYKFQKLTPIDDADIFVYEDAIDFAFANDDIKNVAISGPYSAGKSSVLESYKKSHSDKHFVHLSLAHFSNEEQENSEVIKNTINSEAKDEAKNVDKNKVRESVLEGKILNQLIHQIPADKIPQTNFKVKDDINSKKLKQLTILVSLLIGSILFLLFDNKIATYINTLPNNWVKKNLFIVNQYAPIFAVIVFSVCIIISIYSLIRVQKNRNIFHKISLQGNDIEIFEETDDSYFDKYLNEVLYLFEKIDADVIVFEDIDRFNVIPIFERLREVNTLVNIQRKKEHSKYTSLMFFYLLRDDIFTTKDRTKFFDYIIPIVPIVDSSNSYEQFIKHLEAGGLLDKFNKNFLQSLSLYVDDMRILKNIYNEFVVYFNRLNTTDLDCNKMLALIAYKNLFPRDFSNLQLGKGFIFEQFAQKYKLIENMLSELKIKRSTQIDRINRIPTEILDSQKELDDVYGAKTRLLSRDYSAESKKTQKKYNSECSLRKQAIKDKLEDNIPKLQSELAEINHEIEFIKTKTLKELITRENIDEVFNITHINEIGNEDDFNEIKSSDYFGLLKFLIRNGYIDETYADYMSYFYEGSISTNDKTFLRRITDKRGASYTYPLKEPKKILESPVLKEIEFEQEETLNFDLLKCLFENDNEAIYASYLKRLISQIMKTENLDFLSQYYETHKVHEEFVVQINKHWSKFFYTAFK